MDTPWPPSPPPPPRSPRLGAWVAAARPKTLFAAVAPVVVGAALARRDEAFHPGAVLAALAGALLIQVGTNLLNDFYDYRRGADTASRLGPPRASASGWIDPRRVLQAGLACFLLAAIAGLYLVDRAGWPILAVGLLSLASGYVYTGGPYPLGYHGWGDLFVFAFFGLVAVSGTYYVQALTLPPYVLAAGAGVGALATALLVVNNLRDVDTDRRAGKRTLAVRIGPRATRAEYALLLVAALSAPVVLVSLWNFPFGTLLPLAAAPVAFLLAARLATTQDPRDLNPLLPRTSSLLAAYGALLAVGVIL